MRPMTSDLSTVLSIEAARERLRDLISELAVVRGKVTLASGLEADYYVDLRRITLHHEASRLVGQVMLDLLDRNGIDFDAAGGLTMGADPVGHAIMRTAGDNDRAIDTFVVRKAQKSYGMGRQVEGPEVSGRNVVVLEDTSTTGGSALTAVEALREVLPLVDLVLVMSVEPGFGGQSFIPGSLEKIAQLRAMAREMGLETIIEVDGGISARNAGAVYGAGADVLVAGSSVFGAEDPQAEVVKMLNA